MCIVCYGHTGPLEPSIKVPATGGRRLLLPFVGIRIGEDCGAFHFEIMAYAIRRLLLLLHGELPLSLDELGAFEISHRGGSRLFHYKQRPRSACPGFKTNPLQNGGGILIHCAS